MSQSPVRRFDRAQLEKILLRAAELQATERELADGLTPDEVVALAKEVGIPEAHVRRALVESRQTPLAPPPATLTDAVMGRAVVSAARIVPGDVATVEKALLRWMADREVLAVQRQVPGRIVWEPQGGLGGVLRRSGAVLSGGDRTLALGRAGVVTAEVVAVEPGWVQVTLTADASAERGKHSLGATIALGGGAAATGVLVALDAQALVAAAPSVLMAVLCWPILRTFRKTTARLELGVDRVLDHLEHVRPLQPPPAAAGLLGTLTDELWKALQ